MQPPGGPRAEVSASLPLAPVASVADAASPIVTSELAALSLKAIVARAGNGEPLAGSIAAVLGGLDNASDRFSALIAEAGTLPDVEKLYVLSRQLDAAGRANDAALVLAVLSSVEGGHTAGMLGLAVLATRDGKMGPAGELVAACLEAPERHPRATSLAGIGALERGEKQAAQAYLATAARLARRNPGYSDELQIAQRALLLMHLG